MGMSKDDIRHYCLQELVDLIPNDDKQEQATRMLSDYADRVDKLMAHISILRAALTEIADPCWGGISDSNALNDNIREIIQIAETALSKGEGV